MSMKFIMFRKKKHFRNYFNYDNVKYILTTRPTSVFTGYEILHKSVIIATILQ